MKYAAGVIRALVGLAGAAILCVTVSGCSGDDEESTSWWEDLVSYIPAERSSEQLVLTDVAGARERFGVAPETHCVSGADFDEEQQALDDLISALPSNDLGLLVAYQAHQEDLIGFDICRARRIATAGDAGEIGVYEPAAGFDSIPRRLTERGYSRREHGGTAFFALDEDRALAEPETAELLDALFGDDAQVAREAVLEYLEILFNRVLVDDGIVVRASNDSDIQSAIASRAVDVADRADEAYAVARALGEFHSLQFVHRRDIVASLDEQVGMILGTAVGSGDEAEYERLKEEVIGEIVSGYADWGRLPPSDAVGLGISARTMAGTS